MMYYPIGFRWGKSYGQPVDLVGVCGETGATGVLLITSAVDDDGVLHCAYIIAQSWSADVSDFVSN